VAAAKGGPRGVGPCDPKQKKSCYRLKNRVSIDEALVGNESEGLLGGFQRKIKPINRNMRRRRGYLVSNSNDWN